MLHSYFDDAPQYVNGQRVNCNLDGMEIGCSQAYHMLDVGSAIPAALAPFQNLPGFSFESRGLGIFTAYIPGYYFETPNGGGSGDSDDDPIQVGSWGYQPERWETYSFPVSWSPQQQRSNFKPLETTTEKTPCEGIAKYFENIFAGVERDGLTNTLLNLDHQALDLVVSILDYGISNQYLGVNGLSDYTVANELRNDKHYSDSYVRKEFGMDIHKNPYLGQEDFRRLYQEDQPPFHIPKIDTDQTHHFVAYFSAGINGLWFGSTAHMLADLVGGAGLADAALGNAAYNLGDELRMQENWSAAHKMYIPENSRDRAQRIINLSAKIRKNICR